VLSYDGEEWTVDHAVGSGVYASSKERDGAKTLIKWNEIVGAAIYTLSAASASRK
jgi:hypothetical protein